MSENDKKKPSNPEPIAFEDVNVYPGHVELQIPYMGGRTWDRIEWDTTLQGQRFARCQEILSGGAPIAIYEGARVYPHHVTIGYSVVPRADWDNSPQGGRYWRDSRREQLLREAGSLTAAIRPSVAIVDGRAEPALEVVAPPATIAAIDAFIAKAEPQLAEPQLAEPPKAQPISLSGRVDHDAIQQAAVVATQAANWTVRETPDRKVNDQVAAELARHAAEIKARVAAPGIDELTVEMWRKTPDNPDGVSASVSAPLLGSSRETFSKAMREAFSETNLARIRLLLDLKTREPTEAELAELQGFDATRHVLRELRDSHARVSELLKDLREIDTLAGLDSVEPELYLKTTLEAVNETLARHGVDDTREALDVRVLKLITRHTNNTKALCDGFDREAKTYRERIEEAERKNKEVLRDAWSLADREIQEYRERIGALTEANTKLSAEVSAATERIAEAANLADAQAKAYDALCTSSAATEAEAVRLRGELKQEQEDIERLAGDLVDARRQCDALKQELADAKSKNDMVRDERVTRERRQLHAEIRANAALDALAQAHNTIRDMSLMRQKLEQQGAARRKLHDTAKGRAWWTLVDVVPGEIDVMSVLEHDDDLRGIPRAIVAAVSSAVLEAVRDFAGASSEDLAELLSGTQAWADEEEKTDLEVYKQPSYFGVILRLAEKDRKAVRR